MRRVLLLGILVAGCGTASTSGSAGESLRLGVVVAEPPQVGRRAPDLMLPYATRDGAGPADQPFDLHKELGRVVVISFCRLDIADECMTQWAAFRDRGTSLFGDRGDVVVAGVSTDSVAGLARFARDNELPFKFLGDPARSVARRFGYLDGSRVRQVIVVVGRDGRVRYIDGAFDPFAPASYSNLAAAIQAAKES